MKTFKNWQEALIYFIEKFGHNYKDGYNLVVEFENYVQQNIHGVYYFEE